MKDMNMWERKKDASTLDPIEVRLQSPNPIRHCRKTVLLTEALKIYYASTYAIEEKISDTTCWPSPKQFSFISTTLFDNP